MLRKTWGSNSPLRWSVQQLRRGLKTETISPSSDHTHSILSTQKTTSADELAPRPYHPLQGEKPRQFLTSDGGTIVCVHPALQTKFNHTKPLRPYKPEIHKKRTQLSPEEINFVKKLRSEDPSLWTVTTLARLFNVKKITISKVAPASKERQEELDQDRKLLERMKYYRRKLYLEEQKMQHQKKLEQVIAERKYKFPVDLKNSQSTT